MKSASILSPLPVALTGKPYRASAEGGKLTRTIAPSSGGAESSPNGNETKDVASFVSKSAQTSVPDPIAFRVGARIRSGC